MTIFMARTLNTSITLDPSNTLQCASVAGSGQPQGCIGGISGTIYAAHEDATVIVKAAGTANLQIISGRLLIQNGATARFTFNSAGFAAGSVSIKLVEQGSADDSAGHAHRELPNHLHAAPYRLDDPFGPAALRRPGRLADAQPESARGAC